MNTSQLVRDLQHRLTSLLEDPVFSKARQGRANKRVTGLDDAVITYNMAMSEQLLQLEALLVNGDIKDRKIDDFRKQITAYLDKNGTEHQGYNRYVAIVSEYLALVARQPLHPLEVRHLVDDPPKDTDSRKYCSWKARYINNDHSLCRYCNCLPWPEAAEGNYG